MSDIKEFVEYVVKHLVDKPEDVKIAEREGDEAIILELSVSKGDYGKVIGKKGRNADAIRILLAATSAKLGKRAIMEIIE